MPNIRVDPPRVHMAGSDADLNAQLEVGPHGVALFLSPDADYPLLDIDGTPPQAATLLTRAKEDVSARAASLAMLEEGGQLRAGD